MCPLQVPDGKRLDSRSDPCEFSKNQRKRKQHLPKPDCGFKKERIKQPHDKPGVQNNAEALSSSPAAEPGPHGFFSPGDPAGRGPTIC
jgi:hypothetical protein